MESKYEYQTVDIGTWNRGKHYDLYKDCGSHLLG